MPNVFFSYSHKDEALRDQLETQLAMLKRQGVIETWHDRRILAGEDLHNAIGEHVENDDVILLLISPDFLASDYCYDVEMQRAVERHDAGLAVVIPVILRACEWAEGTPFARLMATPRDGIPVTQWPDRDQAFLEVTKAIRAAVKRLQERRVGGTSAASPSMRRLQPVEAARKLMSAPRSSDLALAKHFTERDQDAFLLEAFEYIANYFHNSLAELSSRNPGVDGDFRRVDANRFFATVYRNGAAAARATVFMGGFGGRSINYVQGHATESNSLNESLSVASDDQSLFLQSMGMGSGSLAHEQKLSHEGGAQLYWDKLIQPLRHR